MYLIIISPLVKSHNIILYQYVILLDYENKIEELKIVINNILQDEVLSNTILANDYKETQIGKHDVLLTKELCDLDFWEQYFDVKGARDWLSNCYSNLI